MNKSWIKIPLLNLTIATLLGLLLRFIPVQSIPGVNFKFFLHAHSHVAFLGWAYMAFFLAILFEFLPESVRAKKTYKIQFWATQVSVVGMLITFPIQGYALFSILFSTLQIILSYIFIISIWKDTPSEVKSSLSFKFVLAAFFFLAISSIGPFALGIFMAQGMGSSPWYHLSIYFYLHFQYNGWFTFMVLGLLVKLFENKKILIASHHGQIFLYLMIFSCLLGYLLSTLWVDPPFIIYIVSFAAALLQLIALLYVSKILNQQVKEWAHALNGWTKTLLIISVYCFVLKVVLQFFSAFIPMFEIRNFIIAYLHLTLIGFISLFIIAYLQVADYLIINSWYKKGLWLIVCGFIASEIILFGQGGLFWLGIGMIPHYYLLLFSISAFIPLGFILLTASQFITKSIPAN